MSGSLAIFAVGILGIVAMIGLAVLVIKVMINTTRGSKSNDDK